MVLNEKEAGDLRSAGTALKEFLPAGEGVNWSSRRYRRKHASDAPAFVRKWAGSMGLKSGDGLYGMETDCGFLEKTEDDKFICGVHQDPDVKPRICTSFQAGSFACRDIRKTVITRMLEEDSVVPSLAGVALGEEVFRNLEDL